MSKGQRAGEGAIAVQVEKGKSYYWCSCGKSSKQPLCDGSHIRSMTGVVNHRNICEVFKCIYHHYIGLPPS